MGLQSSGKIYWTYTSAHSLRVTRSDQDPTHAEDPNESAFALLDHSVRKVILHVNRYEQFTYLHTSMRLELE